MYGSGNDVVVPVTDVVAVPVRQVIHCVAGLCLRRNLLLWKKVGPRSPKQSVFGRRVGPELGAKRIRASVLKCACRDAPDAP